MATPLATIGFVPREQFGTTRRSLETLYGRTQHPFELVCVDGGSPPEVRDYLAKAARDFGFTLLRTEVFLTPNQARNLVLPYVRTKYVAFVDNDVLVAPRWLDALVNCAEETGAWVVGPLFFEFEPERTQLHMFGGKCRIERLPQGGLGYVERHDLPHVRFADLRETLTRRETELIEFHTALVSMEAIRKIGSLDEGFLNNAEHGDLCLQVRRFGKKVYLEPAAQITYTPPKALAGADLRYFQLRWSEAWTAATNDYLRQKYDLSPADPYLKSCRDWIAGHRRHSLAWLPNLRRILGRKATSFLEKHVVAKLESVANLRQFPQLQYGTISRPAVQVVYSPNAQVRIAA